MGRYATALAEESAASPQPARRGRYSRALEEAEAQPPTPPSVTDQALQMTGAAGTARVMHEALDQMDPHRRIQKRAAAATAAREREIEEDYESQGYGPEVAEAHNRFVREAKPFTGDATLAGEGLSEAYTQAKDLNLEQSAAGLVEAGKALAPAALAGVGAGVLGGAAKAAKVGNLGKYGKMLAAEMGVGIAAEEGARYGLKAAGVPDDIADVAAFVGTIPVSGTRILQRARKLGAAPEVPGTAAADEALTPEVIPPDVVDPAPRALPPAEAIPMPPVSRLERARAQAAEASRLPDGTETHTPLQPEPQPNAARSLDMETDIAVRDSELDLEADRLLGVRRDPEIDVPLPGETRPEALSGEVDAILRDVDLDYAVDDALGPRGDLDDPDFRGAPPTPRPPTPTRTPTPDSPPSDFDSIVDDALGPRLDEIPEIEEPTAGFRGRPRVKDDIDSALADMDAVEGPSYRSRRGDDYRKRWDESRAGLTSRMDEAFEKLTPEPEAAPATADTAGDALTESTPESLRAALRAETPEQTASQLQLAAKALPKTTAREILIHAPQGSEPLFAPNRVDGQDIRHSTLAEAAGHDGYGIDYDDSVRARALVNDRSKTAVLAMSTPGALPDDVIGRFADEFLADGYDVKVRPIDENGRDLPEIDYTESIRRQKQNVEPEVAEFVDDIVDEAFNLGREGAGPSAERARSLAVVPPPVPPPRRPQLPPPDSPGPSGPRGQIGGNTVDFPTDETIAFPENYNLRKTFQSTIGLLRAFGDDTPNAIADRALQYARDYDARFGARELQLAETGLIADDLPAKSIVQGAADAKVASPEQLQTVSDMLDADRPSHIPPEKWGDIDPDTVALAQGVRQVLDEVGQSARDLGLLSFIDDQGNLVEMWRDGYFPHVVYAPDKLRSTGGVRGKNTLRERVVDDAVRRGSFDNTKQANSVLDAWIKLNDEAGKVREYAASLRRSHTEEELSNESISQLVDDLLRNPDAHPDWKGKLEIGKYKPLLDWTVQTNQAQDPVDAFRKLMSNSYDPRKSVFSSVAGSLERGREINLPFYEPDAAQAVTSYVRAAERRMAFVEQFGKTGEVLKAFIDRATNIAENRGQRNPSQVQDQIREIVHTALDTPYHRMKENLMSADTSNILRKLQLTKLTFAPLLNLVQVPIGQAMALKLRGSSRDTMRAAVQTLITNRRGARQKAIRAGALANEMQSKFGAQDVGSGETRLGRGVDKMVEHTLRMVGFSASEEFNRIWAANIAEHYARRLSRGLRSTGRDGDLAAQQLNAWGIDPADVARRSNRDPDLHYGFTEDEVLQMAWHINRDVNFSSRSGDMPFTATQDPLWKAVYQFTTFPRSMTALSIDYLADTARAIRAAGGAEGRANMPGGAADALNALLTLGVVMPVVGSVASEARQEHQQLVYDAAGAATGLPAREAREPDTFVDALTDGRVLEALTNLGQFNPDDPEQMKLFADVMGRWFESVAAIGTLGMFHDALESAEFRGLSNFLIGPTASSGIDVMQKAHNAADKRIEAGDPVGAITDSTMAAIYAILYSTTPLGTVIMPMVEDAQKEEEGSGASDAALAMP